MRWLGVRCCASGRGRELFLEAADGEAFGEVVHADADRDEQGELLSRGDDQSAAAGEFFYRRGAGSEAGTATVGAGGCGLASAGAALCRWV
jgi:hypothetical protein